MVAEIIGKKVSVFVAAGPANLRAAREATSTVPIVAYDFETDPVAAGYAANLARPGGNVTGVFRHNPGFRRSPRRRGDRISCPAKSVVGHVWTAPWQGHSDVCAALVGVRSRVRPVDAAGVAAGPNALRGSGPNRSACTFRCVRPKRVLPIPGTTVSALRRCALANSLKLPLAMLLRAAILAL